MMKGGQLAYRALFKVVVFKHSAYSCYVPLSKDQGMTDTVDSLNTRIAELENRLADAEQHSEQMDLVIAHTGVGIWDWNVQTGETRFNERWANIIGYTLEELKPLSIETWVKYANADDLESSNKQLKAHWAGETEYYIFESRMKHKDGHWVWVYDTGQVTEWVSEGVPKRMVGTHVDITEQKKTQLLLAKANQELELLVRIDALTQLPNRRGYDERVVSELASHHRHGKPLAILMIDIDWFKQYNDHYGHGVGDIALKAVGEQLQKSLPRRSDFVGRYGGEEFVAILPFTDINHAAAVCKRILEGVQALGITHDYSFHDKTLSVSIGASSTACGTEHILERADKALYLAKHLGRNQYQLNTQDVANT